MKTYLAIVLLAIPVLVEAQSTPTPSEGAASSLSAGQVPSDESVKELLSVSGTQRMFIDMQDRTKSNILASMNKLFAGKTKATAQQVLVEKTKMSKLLAEEFSWERTGNLFLPVYRDLFTQDEINDLIAFYKGSTGKDFAEKMPVVIRKTMDITQRQLIPMMNEVAAIAKEAQAVATNGVAATPKIKSDFKDSNSGSLFQE